MQAKRYLTIAMSLILALISGCATDMKQSEKLSAQGCFAGAVGAGAVAYLTRLGKKDAKDVAFIAGMMGCIAGSILGHEIGRKADEYESAQVAAEEEIEFNRQSAKSLNAYNQALAINIKDYEKQIDAIKNSELSARERQENLQKTRDIVSVQRKKASEALTNTERELGKSRVIFADYQAEMSDDDSGDWEIQIAALEQEKQILSEHVSTLNALDASI